jgi:glycosyltransferase involved in cell wall biosynthesis
LVSCVLPTANRVWLLHSAVNLFLAQTYTDKELVILDDGQNTPHRKQWIYEPRVRYYHEPSNLSLGEKWNRLIELARGDIIALWADDDYYAPWRLAYQVGLLEQYGDDICAIRNPLSIDAERKLAWHVTPPGGYVASSTMVFRRAIWERCPFEDVATGEDNGFLTNQRKHGATVIEALDYRCVVGRIHRTNTASREQARDHWQVPFEVVQALIGQRDFDAYFGGADGLPR